MTIAEEVDDLLADPPDKDSGLIKQGRYQIIPVGATKPKLHTRVTNYARELEDLYSLTLWKQRMVLLGAATNPALTTAALADSDDSKKLNELAEKAMEAAKANARRDIGSALHRLCERVDQGEDLELPPEIKADVDAYTQLVEKLGITIARIEEVCVIPKYELAGRYDRLVNLGDELYVADLKTGRDLSYSWGSIAMQLALYAMAETVYDPTTTSHSPMPAVNQSLGLVLHLPAGEGTCTAYWVDLQAGRDGLAIVADVKSYRKAAKGYATEVKVVKTTGGGIVHHEVREHAVNMVRYTMDSKLATELTFAWPEGVATLKNQDTHTLEQLDQIIEACWKVLNSHQVPFPPFSDPRSQPSTKNSKGEIQQ